MAMIEANVDAIAKRQLQREQQPEPHQPLRSYFAEELEQQPVEQVEWLVPNYIPCGAVTGFFGDGGTGKDLLLLMLATAMVCGASWLGQNVKQGRVMYFPTEDDDKELRRRMDAIANHYGIQYADFPGQLKIIPQAGKDTVLAVFDQKRGVVKPTALYFAIKKMVEEFKPALVIVGNRVNIFSVNQNDDAQARQCVQLLTAIAIECNTAVIMPGHVSVAGMFNDTGTSGSVQWSNGCRSAELSTRKIRMSPTLMHVCLRCAKRTGDRPINKLACAGQLVSFLKTAISLGSPPRWQPK
jgi:RecA-family ATPase